MYSNVLITWFLLCNVVYTCFFFKQKTAYEMRISDWSSDVCSSDLPAVATRIAALDVDAGGRTAPFAVRREAQRKRLGLPDYPTTTIGSFPQTPEVRKARAAHIRGEIDDAAYDRYLKVETKAAVRWQEEIGLDVLVHGEFERNDMVQYFGEQLAEVGSA